ncbi:hypothetical protein ABNF97_29780 [Plantactinospora sp. B6F1]|uniref:hypothetical protein n=1 Tax=Plantactinospora sp. B6F1 TaxID=3158971 RepID=UPI0032D93B7A
MSVDSPTGARAVVPARNRARMPAGRSNCLNVRLADEEMREISAAARRAGLTPTGYAGEVAVAAARADTQGGAAGATRAELARVQREVFAARAALVGAARSVAGGSEGPLREAVERLDRVAERLHGLLRRVSA